jgi:hypothetical protein
MPEPVRIMVALAVVALAGVCFRLAAAGVGRAGHRRAALLLPFLRLAAILLGAVLMWKVFLGRRSVPETLSAQSRGGASVLCLQDHSGSMDFPVAPGRTRSAIAGAVARRLENRARERLGRGAAVEKRFFAMDVVSSGELESLDRGGTRLAHAVLTALVERPFDALLVLSDGASSDGSVPPTLHRALTARSIPVFAVLTAHARPEMFDVGVTALDCAARNPAAATVSMRRIGEDAPETVPVVFGIDGRPLATNALARGVAAPLVFAMPEQERGWHYCSAAAAPLPGEMTARNNRAFREFYQDIPRHVLLVFDRPRRETVAWAGQIRRLYPDTTVAVAVNEMGGLDLAADDLMLVVLSDVSPGRLPARWRQEVAAKRIPMLLLAGPAIQDWVRDGSLDGLVQEAPAVVRFREQGLAEATVQVGAAALAEDRDPPDTEGLTVNILYSTTPAQGAEVVMEARGSKRRYPLLVSSGPGRPPLYAWLADTSWKWTVHFDPAVRARGAELMALVLESISGREFRRFGLKVGVASRPSETEAVLEIEAAPQSTESDALRDVRLDVRVGEEETVLKARRGEGGRWSCRVTLPRVPLVAWARGRAASSDGGTLESEWRPVLPPPTVREFADPRPRPDLLLAAAAARERFAGFERSDAVIARLLDSIADRGEKPRTRKERHLTAEALLGLLILLLLGTEWFIERRAARG